jgi:hypothetical protein
MGKKKLNSFAYVMNDKGQMDYVLVDIHSPKYGFHQMPIEICDVPLLADGAVGIQYAPGIQGFYAHQSVNGNSVLFHRRLFPNAKPGEEVMHLTSSLDNRRRNLKLGSKSENQRDRKKHREGRLVGATPVGNGRWKSRSWIAGKEIYLGLYDSELEAHQVAMAYEAGLKSNQP